MLANQATIATKRPDLTSENELDIVVIATEICANIVHMPVKIICPFRR